MAFTLEYILNLLKVDDDANKALDQLYKHLVSFQYECTREVHVPDRGDNRPGRIDLVAKKLDSIVAIEFDRSSPRLKSVFKLRQYKATSKYILLRGGNFRYSSGDINVLSIPLYDYTQYKLCN